MQLALKIIRSVLDTDMSREKFVIFASIINNQSLKTGVSQASLLRQYKELASEIYKNDNSDFFRYARKALESKLYEELR